MRMGIEQYERDRKEYEKLKRQVRKQSSKISFEEIGLSPELVCQDCGRVCLSKACLIRLSRNHNILWCGYLQSMWQTMQSSSRIKTAHESPW